MPTLIALEHSHFSHFDFSSFDSQDLPLYKSLGYFLACRFHYPAKGLPGNAHPFGGLLLIQGLVIRQSEGLELVHG